MMWLQGARTSRDVVMKDVEGGEGKDDDEADDEVENEGDDSNNGKDDGSQQRMPPTESSPLSSIDEEAPSSSKRPRQLGSLPASPSSVPAKRGRQAEPFVSVPSRHSA